MNIINDSTTRAAAITVASSRVDIAKNNRDRALNRVKEKAAELEEAHTVLKLHEAELRVEQFTLGALIDGATNEGGVNVG